ncbi:hypothetical protein Tco_1117063 [Tanacetum coccineum]
MSARGLDIPSVICPICGERLESSDHLFFSCSFVAQVYVMLARWWDIHIPPLSSYQHWLEWQFAQRLRVRNLQYIAELEKNVQALQAEGSEVCAEVEYLNQQRRLENLAQEQLIKYKGGLITMDVVLKLDFRVLGEGALCLLKDPESESDSHI